jgi:hypothetical protein
MASEKFHLHNHSFRLKYSMKEVMFKQRTSEAICASGKNHAMCISGLSGQRHVGDFAGVDWQRHVGDFTDVNGL